jgi:glycosyltransferase involved in cell wall biosynthesis
MIQDLHKKIDSVGEVPMCVVVDRLTFHTPFHFEYTLNSVFNQNYSNFFAVVANDGSKLGDVLLRKYLHFYDVPRERYLYLENKEKLDTMAITLQAVGSHCSKDSFVINLAGNDELIGRNVLKIFSAVSQDGQPLLMYSNSYFHWPGGSYDYGIAGVYTEAEIKGK